jgi:hypothetical protein
MGTKDLADKNKIGYIDLSPMGVSSVAFTKENALLILKIIRQENIPILGGDVCFVINGKIQYTGDNWSFSKKDDETLRQYTERSYQATFDYITKYYITEYREERITYFWKIPIRKQKIQKLELNEVPLFDIVIPGDQEFCGCYFY